MACSFIAFVMSRQVHQGSCQAKMSTGKRIAVVSKLLKYEPQHDKTSSGVSDQARHKPACAAT